MGLMDIVRRAAPIAGVVAAPFTGGASLLASGAIGALGQGAADAAGGMADERTLANQYGINRGQLANQQYGTQQGAKTNLLSMQEKGMLDRAKMGVEAPSARANQVLKGSLMSLVKPAKITHPRATIPGISGGLTPAALSQIARQTGVDLQDIASTALKSGSDVPELPDYVSQGMVEAPELPEYEQAGKLETGLGIAGGVGKIVDALARQGSGQPRTPDWNPNAKTGPQQAVNVPGQGVGQFPGWVYGRDITKPA